MERAVEAAGEAVPVKPIEEQRAFIQRDVSEKLVAAAAKSDPKNPEIHYHLGAVLAKLGKRAESRKELELALRSPGFPEAAEARRILDSLR